MVVNLLQGVLSGILLGGVYGLISMGLAMIFGVLRIVNFAHGDFVTLAMYLAFFLIVAGHLNPYLTLLVTVPGLFVFGFALERTLIRGCDHLLFTVGHSWSQRCSHRTG